MDIRTFGSIAPVVAVLAAIVAVGVWIGGLEYKVETIDGDVRELKSDVGQLKSDVSQLKSDVGQLKSDVGQLKSDAVELKAYVNIILSNIGVGTTTSTHPVKLSKVGKEIATNINAEGIVKMRIDELRPEFVSISNSYDIQEKAMELGESIYKGLGDGSKDKDIIKQEAFKNGLPVSQIYPVFSVLLRDTILKEKGIPLQISPG